MTNTNFKITLNQHGEVADFVNESQFEGGESPDECVAFSGAICKYAGQPDHRPTGVGEQIDQLADLWYGQLEGSIAASNTNGMSDQDEYTMLQGMGLGFHPIAITGENARDVASVKAWLRYGFPVMICGAESGMFDMDMGNVVPYSWIPMGNHCIVASGISPDGNLLVRDTASIAPNGVRPGPRRYNAGKLELVSATAVAMPWLPAVAADFDPTQGGIMSIDLSNPTVAAYFDLVNNNQWQCKENGYIIHGAILAYYQSLGGNAFCGLTYLGLPKSNEIPLDADGNVMQIYERGLAYYDPQHTFDNPPGAGSVYHAHVPQAMNSAAKSELLATAKLVVDSGQHIMQTLSQQLV